MHRLPLASVLVIALGLSGCGTPAVDAIPGDRVGSMAERQLEAMHSELATGTMTCPRLDFTVDASVRCVRIAELSGGRQIKVFGTVTVISTRNGGKLHVRLDDRVSEFGITGEHLANDLRARTQLVLKTVPDKVSCPYLIGERGAEVRCTVRVLDHDLIAPVAVVKVDPAAYRTVYRFTAGVFDPKLNPGLPSLLRSIRSGGLGS